MRKEIVIRKYFLVLILVTSLGSLGAASAIEKSGAPSWKSATGAGFCGPESVCVEWDEADGAYNGVICCIPIEMIQTPPAMSTCQKVFVGPRPDPDGAPDPDHLSGL